MMACKGLTLVAKYGIKNSFASLQSDINNLPTENCNYDYLLSCFFYFPSSIVIVMSAEVGWECVWYFNQYCHDSNTYQCREIIKTSPQRIWD